jgi:hypothetical protein
VKKRIVGCDIQMGEALLLARDAVGFWGTAFTGDRASGGRGR